MTEEFWEQESEEKNTDLFAQHRNKKKAYIDLPCELIWSLIYFSYKYTKNLKKKEKRKKKKIDDWNVPICHFQ